MVKDGIVILASSKRRLQRMLNNIVSVCKNVGMELNQEKTKVMVIEEKPDNNIKIIAKGKQLEHVKVFWYKYFR